MGSANIYRVEHYKDGDTTILYNGGWDGNGSEDLIIGENEVEARQVWRKMHPEPRYTIGRVTRLTPLRKHEVDLILDRADFMGVSDQDVLAILRSINSRLP